MNSTHCPTCQKDIGRWAIFRAALPNLIRCPHCRAKLMYRPVGWGMFTLSCLLFTPLIFVSAYYLLIQWNAHWLARYALYTASIAIIWAPFEWHIASRLRTRHELVLRQS